MSLWLAYGWPKAIVDALKHLSSHQNQNHPPSLPLIGHIHLLKNPLHLTLASLSSHLGPIFSLRQGCKSFLIISSALTMEWGMSILLTQPHVLQKLQPEIDKNIGHDHLINDADLPKLSYLRCIVPGREGSRFLPFGMGRRACPGAAMAMRTVSLALGAFVQCFEWGKGDVEVDFGVDLGVTLHKAKPLEAVCVVRNEAVHLL